MKIFIIYNFQQGPGGGGGNQFLKALAGVWQKQGVLAQSPKEADVFLFNSHQALKQVFTFKKKFPEKIFVHRIDGPMQGYRKSEKYLDDLIFKINSLVADGTVFQSNWSREANKKLLPFQKQFETVIYNASNPLIFNAQNKEPFNPKGKIRLAAASWSANLLKGFDTYQYLDGHLDFKRYEMVFVGKSPVKFKNIRQIDALAPEELAQMLKQSDIFVFASKVESCSNSLIEAISCGLPVVAFNGTSNPEVVGGGGELFDNDGQAIEKIEKVAKNYLFYQKNLPRFEIGSVAGKYFNFAKRIFDEAQSGFYYPCQVGFTAGLSFAKDRGAAFYQKILSKLFSK
ncbi:MAG: glycosyltransferase [Patescibacteria group bacterium]|nr:glycosyltransferase [Patescibacteria group bacterium]